jgi:hypothetical protein
MKLTGIQPFTNIQVMVRERGFSRRIFWIPEIALSDDLVNILVLHLKRGLPNTGLASFLFPRKPCNTATTVVELSQGGLHLNVAYYDLITVTR